MTNTYANIHTNILAAARASAAGARVHVCEYICVTNIIESREMHV